MRCKAMYFYFMNWWTLFLVLLSRFNFRISLNSVVGLPVQDTIEGDSSVSCNVQRLLVANGWHIFGHEAPETSALVSFLR